MAASGAARRIGDLGDAACTIVYQSQHPASAGRYATAATDAVAGVESNSGSFVHLFIRFQAITYVYPGRYSQALHGLQPTSPSRRRSALHPGVSAQSIVPVSCRSPEKMRIPKRSSPQTRDRRPCTHANPLRRKVVYYFRFSLMQTIERPKYLMPPDNSPPRPMNCEVEAHASARKTVPRPNEEAGIRTLGHPLLRIRDAPEAIGA